MTSSLRLTKAHGLGNDFLIALAVDNPGLDERVVAASGAVAAKRLCDRHRGVGADGLIFGLPANADGADLRMVLFNADGSEAEISGNGIRCLGQAALRSGGRRDGRIVIDAGSGRRTLVATATDDPAVDLLRVEMGDVTDGPALGPEAAAFPALRRGTGAIGNPHLVLQVESLDAIDPAEAGPRLEADVPGGVNVHFLQVAGPDTVRLVHWERGAGVTEACGSGATVSASLAHGWGLVGPTVEVLMPGGSATVEVGSPMALTGEACHIATVEVPGGW
ncbi:MAG: diaminopimelate epimerase [Acidimicrobiales bacterium]